MGSMSTILPEKWARDHYTTIAYVFTCVGSGPDIRRMRTDPQYPTRVKGGVTVSDHTDLDCLDDAEAAGVLINVGTGAHPHVQFTPEGLKIGQWLCQYIDGGGANTMTLTWEDALSNSGANL